MSEKCLVQVKPKVTKEVDIYFRGGIEKFEHYDELVKKLAELGKDDSVTLHLNSPGGDCSIGFFVIDQLLLQLIHFFLLN